MKNFVILFSVILGSALSFKAGKEYVYQYEGTVDFGIPEISSKSSGAAIKCKVRVQPQGNGIATFRLEDILVGSTISNKDCTNCNLPIQYTAIPNIAETLGSTFQANIKQDSGEVMLVSASDEEWAVNTKKAIALLFVNQPIRRHGTGFELEHSATISEPTIFGQCSCDYSVAKSGSTYSVVRSINFDSCSPRSALRQFGVGNGTGDSNGLFADFTTRSSTWRYTIEKNSEGLVITDASITGLEISYAGKSSSDRFVAQTQTTYQLLQETDYLTTTLNLPTETRAVKTWLYEVYSPYAAPAGAEEWINYRGSSSGKYAPLLSQTVLTGIALTADDLAANKAQLQKNLAQVAALLGQQSDLGSEAFPSYSDSAESEILSLLDDSKQLIRGVDSVGLTTIFEGLRANKDNILAQKQLDLLIDVASASGAAGPISFVLKQIKAGKVSTTRALLTFIGLPQTVLENNVVPELLDFMQSLDFRRDPWLTGQVYISMSQILKKTCFKESTASYATPYQIYGSSACDADSVGTSFVNFLQKRLQSTDQMWQKLAILSTIMNSGSAQALPLLTKIVGSNSAHPDLRRLAMCGLIRQDLPYGARDAVFSLLQPILDDSNANSILRQQALLGLLTWRPSVSWWHRLAVLTWTEKDSDLAALAYQIIESTATMTDPEYSVESRVCRFLVPIAKAFSGSSGYVYNEFNPQDWSVASLRQYQLGSGGKGYSSYLFASEKFHGLEVDLLQVTTSRLIDPSISQTIDRFLPKNTARSLKNRMNQQIFDSVSESSGEVNTLYVRAFDNLHFLIPVNAASFGKMFTEDGFSLLEKYMTGGSLEVTRYQETAPIITFTPNEMGLPIVTSSSSPTLFSASGSAKLNLGDSIGVTLGTQNKIGLKVLYTVSTITGWDQKSASVGLDFLRAINLPAKTDISFQSGDLTNLTVSIEPTGSTEVSVLKERAIPFVEVRSIASGSGKVEKYSALSLSDDSPQGVEKVVIPLDQNYYGLSGALEFTGDKTFPYTWGNFLEVYNDPTELVGVLDAYSPRLFSTQLRIDPSKSDTKAVEATVAFAGYLDQFDISASFIGAQTRSFAIRKRYAESNSIMSTKGVFEFGYSRSAIPNVDDKSDCFLVEVDTARSYIKNRERMIDLLKRDKLGAKVGGIIKGGPDCSQTIGSLKGSLRAGHERSQHLANKMIAKKTENLSTSAALGYLDLTVSYDDSAITPLASRFVDGLYDYIRGDAYPQASFSYLSGKSQRPAGEIRIDGKRSIATPFWQVQVRLPSQDIEFDQFELPTF